MSEPINNGGPAFPVSTRPLETEPGFGHQDGPSTWQYGGMTLRDYFAAKAIPFAVKRLERNYSSDLENEWTWGHEDFEAIAEHAYDLADAMLKAREA